MKRRSLTSIVSMVITSFLVAGIAVAKPAIPGDPEDNGCTRTIPSDVLEVNGQTNFSDLLPGDVLCLPAGERGNLKLINLHGEPGKPITVRNSGGTVKISGSDFLSGGIGIYSSSYLRITGTGEGNRCGAQYSTEDQACGIVISGTHKGIKIETGTGPAGISNLEIDHLSVSNTSKDVKTRGIAIHPAEKQLIVGLYIHHNYIGETLAEGLYLGTEPHGRPFEIMGKIENVEVSYNLVENTGYDGIKIKVGVRNISIHHNVVRNTGLSNTPAHQGGIKMAMTSAVVFNNYVENVFEGIRTGRPVENSTLRLFNNVVVHSRSVGIEAKELGAEIFNNTVVWCGESGIVGDSVGAKIFNNIIAGCEGNPIKRIFRANNLVGPLEKINFIDPSQNNFRLQPTSPGIDAGIDHADIPLYDFDGYPRLHGQKPDMGAFEYQ